MICRVIIVFAAYTWEQRKLGELADIVGGGTPSTSNSEYWDGDIDWYAPAEIANQIFVSSSERKITQQGYDNSSAKMLPVGTVLFTSRAGIGKTAILRKEGCTNQGFQSIVPHENMLDSYFIFSRTEELKRYGEIKGAGSTFVEVSGKQMASMELMMPKTIEEQKKIGSYFSQLDNLITLHQRKLDKLHKVKRSLLERMFPRNGANVPEIRFSGFTDAWEQCELGAIIQAVQELTSDFENYPLYSLTIENGVTPKTERYERSFLITKETDLFKIVPEQCFVSNPMNLRFGAIGFNDSGKKVSVSGYYDVFSIDRGECSNFWCVYLKTANSLKRFDDVAIGSLIEKRRVHFSQLTEMSFPAPNMNEKRKLGEFFERLERLITLHQRKLDKLRQIKRSMLEKMFV